MSGTAAEHDLEGEQPHHQQQVLAQGLLRRRRADQTDRVVQRRVRLFLFLAQEGPGPDQEADAGNQQHHADYRPHDILGGWLVAHQRLVGPVVGVGGDGVRALGGGRPGGPEEEVGHLFTPLQARQRVLLHGEAPAAVLQCRVIAEQRDVVGGGLADCLDTTLTQRQYTVPGTVVTVLALQAIAQHGLLVFVEFAEGLAVLLAGAKLEPGGQLTVQPVGSPVGSLVSAMAPDRAELHAADALPGSLPVKDVSAAEQVVAGNAAHLVRDRRRLAINLATEVTEDAEGHRQHGQQRPPELAVFTHGTPPHG